jgi:hypothetical protein
MEKQILELIEEEVVRRVGLRMTAALDVIAKTYDIPIERLVKDTAGIECNFCRGILKSRKRCLKQPQTNGFCKFHQSQVPAPQPVTGERVPAPWE